MPEVDVHTERYEAYIRLTLDDMGHEAAVQVLDERFPVEEADDEGCPTCGSLVPEGRTYCSDRCRRIEEKRRYKESRGWTPQQEFTECVVCAKPLPERKGNGSGRARKYCSRACGRKAA